MNLKVLMTVYFLLFYAGNDWVYSLGIDCDLATNPKENHREIILSRDHFANWSNDLDLLFNNLLEKNKIPVEEEKRILGRKDGGINGQDVEFISGLPKKFKFFEAGDTIFRRYSPNNKEISIKEGVIRSGARPFILPVAAHLRKEYSDLTGVFFTRPSDDPARLWLGYTKETPHIDFRLPPKTKILDFDDGNLLILGPPSIAAWIAKIYQQHSEGQKVSEMYDLAIKQFDSRGMGIRHPLVVPIFIAGDDKLKQIDNLSKNISQYETNLEKNFSLSEEYARWYFQRRIEPTLSKPNYQSINIPSVLYRGMFISLKQLKKILKEGMKTEDVEWTTGDKDNANAGISFSSNMTEASSYIFHNAHKKFNDGLGVGVIFRVRKGNDYELLDNEALNRTKTIYKKYNDISPDEIDEIYLWGEYGPQKISDAIQKIKVGKLNPQSSWAYDKMTR